MSESFPIRPDADWYAVLVSRFADAVPAAENLRIRSGLQKRVEDLFHDLDMADRFRVCRIHGITKRSAGFVVIDARCNSRATEADKRMCNFVLEPARERLSETCEHCGNLGEIILKIGMEARLEDPNIELRDRLICMECYESWRHRHD